MSATDVYDQPALVYAAAGNRDPNVVRLLVDAGADVNRQTPSGWTALMYAARDNSNPEILSALLEHGANVMVVNYLGKTAFDYAKENPILAGMPVLTRLEKHSPTQITTEV